jgi:hypothetical protein
MELDAKRVYKGLRGLVRRVRILENDRNLKRHCSAKSMKALAELSLMADKLEAVFQMAVEESDGA